MNASIVETYRQFLRQQLSLEELRDWLALNQWDLPASERDLADQADAALAWHDDGHLDDKGLEDWLRWALERNVNQSIRVRFTAVPASSEQSTVSVAWALSNGGTSDHRLVATAA